jgi:hypothetical protein
MSYLSDRSQCVQTDGALSAVLLITSGVVQGCPVLVPLLFSMFINDIVCQITSCRVQIYISCELHRIENCIRNMNMDIDRIHQWSIENCLAINPENLQALLVNPSILPSPIVSPLPLQSNHIAFVDRVRIWASFLTRSLRDMIKLLSFARNVFQGVSAAIEEDLK